MGQRLWLQSWPAEDGLQPVKRKQRKSSGSQHCSLEFDGQPMGKAGWLEWGGGQGLINSRTPCQATWSQRGKWGRGAQAERREFNLK